MRIEIALVTELDVAGDALVLAEDAQKIASPDLGDLFFRVAASDEFHGEVGHLVDLHEADEPAAAVEVDTDTDVINPGNRDRVVDVIGQVRRPSMVRAIAAIASRDCWRSGARSVEP